MGTATALELLHAGYLDPENPQRKLRAGNGAVDANKELGELLVRHGNDALRTDSESRAVAGSGGSAATKFPDQRAWGGGRQDQTRVS